MNTSALTRSVRHRAADKPNAIDLFARKLVFAQLERLHTGRVRIVDAEGARTFGQDRADLRADVDVRHNRFYRAVAFGGSIGAAEAYMDGLWRCNDLVSLLRMMLLNGELSQVRTIDTGWGRLAEPFHRAYHALRRNTPLGSRRNIAAHYDLGNDFFRLFLDETMMYSSAVFPQQRSTLAEASRHKIDRICQKLDLQPHDHLLEIGTGWGGFAVHAAKRYGCRVTTTTISREQYHLARKRVTDAGLQDRVEVLLNDYRDLDGQYDKLVSIEMIEAVGHHYFDAYFRKCGALLKPDGLMMLQAITMSDWAYERARRSVDLIKRYIFPGSCIPSLAAMSGAISRVTDMRIFHLEDIGPHYARTLRAWRERLRGNLDHVREMGFSDAFIRMWEYYFCYCEAGFQERYISDVQMLLSKPLNRRPPVLPNLVPQGD